LRLASVSAHPGETRDVDTWDDLLVLRDQLEG
jgi:CTP:molybdopterin cytidylyltransferase MocA